MSRESRDIDRDWLLGRLDDLAGFGADPGGGVSRPAYSPADLEARRWLNLEMETIGLEVAVDGALNGVGRLEGTGQPPRGGAIAIGSHTDTVPNGGRFDGALGVLAAMAAAKTIIETETALRHPLEIINFAGEEATLLGTIGSRAMAGVLPAGFFDSSGYGGLSTREILRAADIDEMTMLASKRDPGSLAGFLELHIEQGARLERKGRTVGVVEGIVGIRRYNLVSEGTANHAGTTAMADRDDALVRAGPFIRTVRDVAVRLGIVATIGTVEVTPGAPNVIPGRVRMSVEIRSLDNALMDQAQKDLQGAAKDLGCHLEQTSRKEPVACDHRFVDAVEAGAHDLGISAMRLESGAGHDAMSIAHLCPVGMVFVPSIGGVSHSPDEYTKPEDCVAGAQVLLAATLQLDSQLD